MFRDPRRKRQLIPEKETLEILIHGTSGVLALAGDNGYPYALPISYVYSDGKIYFHSAKSGHKIDAVKRCEKASFCVIAEDNIIPEEYTTYYKSVIVFGKLKIIEDESEKRSAIEKLALKYNPTDSNENRSKAIEREYKPLCMLVMEIEHLTGKEAIELTRERI